MISIEYKAFCDIPLSWDVCFYGVHDDDRDRAVKSFLLSRTLKQFEIKYVEDELALSINNELVQIHDLGCFVEQFQDSSIIIDATSTTVSELLLICKFLAGRDIKDFDIVYVEPEEYVKSSNNEFLLSDSGRGFMENGVPSLTLPFYPEEDNHIVFLLGYEGDRFNDAIEALQINSNQVSLIFGVPSFKLTWEINSVQANLKTIMENELNDSFTYCGANNPAAVAREMKQLFDLKGKKNIFVVPIGTKPQVIGCLPIFQNEYVGLIWDHPMRKSGRTIGVSKIQLVRNLYFDV